MAFLAPIAGELILTAEEGLGAGNLVAGAETVASTFKNEIMKGIPWGLGEGAGFIAGSKVIENVKKDLGIDKPPPKKRHRTRRIG
jgi:hypothetical protein